MILEFDATMKALESYCTYIYYSFFTETIQKRDLKNLVSFLEHSLQHIIFEAPTPKNQEVNDSLNKSLNYAHEMIKAYEIKNYAKMLHLNNRISELTILFPE